MEYTKDMILHVNYGQGAHAKKENIFYKISSTIAKHKVITTVILITTMLIALDFVLVGSFLQILSRC